MKPMVEALAASFCFGAAAAAPLRNSSIEFNASAVFNQTAELSTCSPVTDGDACVAVTTLGVHQCVWCPIDAQCHDVGSLQDPCPNHCCASQSSASTCDYEQPEDIPQVDGDCDGPGNPTNSTPFDLTTAQVMVYAAQLAYCPTSCLTGWSCGYTSKLPALIDVSVIDVKDLQAFVGYASSTKEIFISFRGTVETSIANWIRDISFVTTAPYSQFPSVHVHSGFYGAYMDLQPQIMSAIKSIRSGSPNAKAVVTGHSLGAAMAELCAFDLALENVPVKHMYTFGCPRVGNYEFHVAMTRAVPNNWRNTHHNDIVPHAPPEAAGFYHTSTEVFYPASGLGHVVCDASGEDPHCSNRCAASGSCTSVSDHLDYLGVSMGEGEAGC